MGMSREVGQGTIENAIGYASLEYARALACLGAPTMLPAAGAWLLTRQIGDTGLVDAMGCYPFLVCSDWTRLVEDVANLPTRAVSIYSVIDPFSPLGEADLRKTFPDLVKAYKTHYVVDLTLPPLDNLPSHHRRNVRKAERLVEVSVHRQPAELSSEWRGLYHQLVSRHGIRGLTNFPDDSLAAQLTHPDVTCFVARRHGTAVGMLLWMAQGDVAHYHLGAYSDEGYDLCASYALFPSAIRHFAGQGFRWLGLGGGAGLVQDDGDGLAKFKRGWSTGARTAYFCGRINDHAAYRSLCTAYPPSIAGYFPAYRSASLR
jgi:hypothetical protein